jgi:hypothetical protein
MENPTVLYITESVANCFLKFKLADLIISQFSIRDKKYDCPSENISLTILLVRLIKKINNFFTIHEGLRVREISSYFVENCNEEINNFQYLIFKGGFVLIIPQSLSSQFILNPTQVLFDLVTTLKEIEMVLSHSREGILPLSDDLKSNFKIHAQINERARFLNRYDRIPWSPPDV